MTERKLFYESVPMIVEMVVECQKMSLERYTEIKKEIIQNAHENAKPFIRKVFIVIDDQLCIRKKCKK